MADNTYLFREGYSISEMENRLNADDLRSEDDPLVEEILQKADLDLADLYDKEPQIFLAEVAQNVDDEEYEDFIKRMFEKYGEKGDRFNIQFYGVEGQSYDRLTEAAEMKVNGLSNEDRSTLSVPIELESSYTDDENRVSFKFLVKDHKEVVNIEESDTVYNPETGERVQLGETDLAEVEHLYKDNDYPIEVRASPQSDLVTISRSEGREGIRQQILGLIKSWGVAE